MNIRNHLVIIGTGLAGYMLAKEWRKLDSVTKLTLITADEGQFYSKPLLSTALAQHKTAETLVVNDVKNMAQELNATILNHTHVIAIDAVKRQVLLAEDCIDYDRLVLACGAEKVAPPVTGNALKDIQSVNNLMEYGHFREWLVGKQHIAIIGSGLVGCEFANDLLTAGYQVTVIAPDQHPLATLIPHAMGQHFQHMLSDQGLTWHLSRFALSVNYAKTKDGLPGTSPTYQIELDQGEIIYADGVFSAVGLRPNVRLAKSAGVTVNNGIVVDRFLRTSNSHIFALGDCVEVDGVVKQYVAPILQCARALAKVLTQNPEPVHYPIMPIVVKTPACPLVVYPPPVGLSGQWQIEGESPHLSALFHDEQGQLQGYVLVGNKVRDKMNLAKQLPLVFTN